MRKLIDSNFIWISREYVTFYDSSRLVYFYKFIHWKFYCIKIYFLGMIISEGIKFLYTLFIFCWFWNWRNNILCPWFIIHLLILICFIIFPYFKLFRIILCIILVYTFINAKLIFPNINVFRKTILIQWTN